jgi:hypothetical protein
LFSGINDLYVLRTGRRPLEANPVLVIDPYCVLALPVPLKRFRPVLWRNRQL